MKLLKKITAIFILLIMWITLNSPIISYAAETGGQTEDVGTEYEIKDEETWDVSKNGDGSVIATWDLENKKITISRISGNGEMKDWTFSSKEDWHNTQYANIVEKVEIKSGITNIGDFAFYNLTNVIRIVIPNTVTKIEADAFWGCSSLENITIPNGVTSIREYTFYGCSSLETITIPNSVTSIGGWAFEDCYSLKSIDIPNSVTSIDGWAFEGCSSLENITIPNSLTIIEWGVFYGCSSLKSIIIPNSVRSIGEHVFSRCSSLESITVNNDNPNYVSVNDVIYNKTKTKLLVYPGGKKNTSFSIPSSVTIIGEEAFSNNSYIRNVTIPNSVKRIKKRTFMHCSSLKVVTIPDSVTSIEEGAFEACSSLKDITIPNSVTSVGASAFLECKGPIKCYTNSEAHKRCEEDETLYVLLDNNTPTFSIKYKIPEEETWDISENGDGSVMAKWTLENNTVTISGNGQMKKSFSVIDNEERASCIGKYSKIVEKVVIQNGVTNIGNYTFKGCSSLTSITIPSSVKKIGSCAFMNCSYLKSIIIPNGVTDIEWSTFEGCSSLTSITIPDSVTNIMSYAFWYCSSLNDITIPSSVTHIGINDGFR